jgi:DEAD/DEAH box helicase
MRYLIKSITPIRDQYQHSKGGIILNANALVQISAPGKYEKQYKTQNKHQVLIHSTPYKIQPTGKEMGKITNDLKRSYSDLLSINQILSYFSNGHSIMLSNAEVDNDNRFRFISSSVFAIDIDDDEKITDPTEVIFSLKEQIAGIFYTFSHRKKGNRYRLVFQLDQTINDELKMRGIIDLITKDLIALGLPVDTQAKNPLQIVRGGTSHVMVNENNILNTSLLLERLKKEETKRQQELYDGFKKELRPIHFDILKDMAQQIGHIPSGSGQGETWKRLVVAIKHYTNAGFINDEEGFEIFDIISGGEQSERSWKTLRANGQATIASFVHEAKKCGYKGKYIHYTNELTVKPTYISETIQVKDYIPVDVAKDLIQRKQKILVDSPTGSGKTTSFLNAFKELATDKKHFYIFAAPTIALTEQNATAHNLRAIKGKTSNLFKTIHKDVKNGQRIFISTYDMTPVLVEFLKMTEQNIQFTLVVDELHKFVTDYDLNYRFEAIRGLYEVGKAAASFIGLSGTIDDIYKNEFETVVKIDNGKPMSPCQEFAVYTYEKRDNALAELAQLTEIWTSKRKLLIYIQSKNKIEQLRTVLRRKGIKVRTINANNKSNLTYKRLVEQATIDEEIQVILTTSVIADGVNIKNDVEWEVIAVCNDFSNLFNYSSIKQISNRLRNSYRRFSLFIQEPKNTNNELFRLENAYQSRLSIAENITDEINKHAFFDPKLFRSSEIERIYGIKQGIDNNLEVDTLHLRHSVSKEQERYFYGNRLAFIKAVEKALFIKAKGILNITKEIKNKRLDLTFISEVINALEEKSKLDKESKEKSIIKVFTKSIYDGFLENNDHVISEFKSVTTHSHFSCIQKLSNIADYETCKSVVRKIKRDADTHSFYNNIRHLTETIYYRSLNRPSKTKNVLEKLLTISEFVSSEEYKVLVSRIAKETRVKPKDVKAVEKMILFESTRSKRERFKRIIGPITVEHISNTFELPVEKVKAAALKYAKSQTNKSFETVIKSKLNTHY